MKKNQIERTCQNCGKKFYVAPYKIKIGKGKFCSKKCHNIWMSKNQRGENSPFWKVNKLKRNCIICDKSFYTKLSIIKKGNGKFCSKKCRGIWLKGKNNPAWCGGDIKRICQLCGKEFYTSRRQIKKGGGKFCSCRCNAIYRMKHQKTKDTLIEILMEQELIKNKIPYMKQVPIEGIALVDFLLPNRVIIQADGDYFHSKEKNKGKDIAQDTVLYFKGYKVFRFWEHEIKKSAKKCIEKIYIDKEIK